MDGFKAYKYYTALKLHFTSQKYDVFIHRGHVRGTREKFNQRNDRYIFEKLARRYSDKDFIQYVASNLMYDNSNVIYDDTTGQENYKEYIRRKQSITKVFTDDLQKIIDSKMSYNINNEQIPTVMQLFLGGKITIETLVILNDFDGILDKVRSNTSLAIMLENDLLRIEKSKKFVKYDSYKVMKPYTEFIQDINR